MLLLFILVYQNWGGKAKPAIRKPVLLHFWVYVSLNVLSVKKKMFGHKHTNLCKSLLKRTCSVELWQHICN